MNPNKIYILMALLLAVVLSGCNLFEIFHSPEESGNFDTLAVTAEAYYRHGDYRDAAAVLDKALNLRPDAAAQRLLRMRALLLANTGGKPVPLFFPELFSAATSLPPLGGLTGSALTGLLSDLQTAADDGNILTNTNNYAAMDSAFYLEHTVNQLLLAQLTLSDGNSNGVPGETADPLFLESAATLRTNANFSTNQLPALTSALQQLQGASNSFNAYRLLAGNAQLPAERLALSNCISVLSAATRTLAVQAGGTP